MYLRQLNNLKIWQMLLSIVISLHIFAMPTAWADPDVIAQNYASAESPNIQSQTAGYNLLAGDVGYSKTQIQGALPYTLNYRGVLRGNLSAAQVMESQENSTSGWTDNYQGYVSTITFGYQVTNYTLAQPTYTGGSPYPYTLTSSANPTTTTQMSIYFVQLPGESVIAAFKDETTNGTETFTRLYSADPEGDIQAASSSGAGVDALPWKNNLGEYTFVRSGNTINISKNGINYTVASNINTITSVPAYSNTTYAYYNSSGNGATQVNNPTAPAGSLSNAAVYQAVAASAETTTFQRVTGITYPNGKQLTLSYDTNNNLTQVSDNRHNVLTFQHTFKANPSASTQTLNESRVVTQVTLQSGTQGDTQTAVFTWNTYNVLEPATGNTVQVFNLASSSSPIAGSYSYTNQLVSIGATYPYISNEAYYKAAQQNNTAQPLASYVFPVLAQVINSASKIEQQWNITQNYAVTLNSTTGLYYNSTAKTTLEAFRPGYGSANAMDMTAVYDDVAKTITMSYSPDGSQTATANISTVINSPTDVTINVSGAPSLSVKGKPITSAEFNTSTNRMLNFTDANGVKSVYTYDGLNRVLTATQASGTSVSRTTSYTYTTLNTTPVPNTVALPEMNVANVLNARGQIVQQTRSYPTSSSSKNQTWNYYYNEDTTLPNYGLLYYYTGPAYAGTAYNDIESWYYDSYGNVILHNKVTLNPNTSVETTRNMEAYYNFNSAGQPQKIAYADGTSDQFTYDSAYRTLSTVHGTTGATQTTSTTYDGLERPITSTDADGHTTTNSYDGVGRLAVVTDPSGNQTNTRYFQNNTVSSVTHTNPQGTSVASTWNTLDANGRLYTTRQGTANSMWVAISYDGNGNVTQTRTALGIINSWTYDALNRVISHTDGNGKVDTKGYDDVDNNTSEHAANSAGSNRGFIYHSLMQTDSNTDFGLKTYTYDQDSHLLSKQHADHICSNGTVDQLGRPQGTTCTGSNTALSLQVNETYGYDQSAFGNLDTVTSNLTSYGVNTNYTYDTLHRVTGKTQTNLALPNGGFASNSQKVNYSYTTAGRMTRMTYPSGNVINYSYDGHGVLNGIQLGSTPIATNISFDGANRLTGWSWGAGGSFALSLTDQGLVQNVDNHSSTNDTFYELYGYDVDGRLTKKTMNNTNINTYGYDNDSQLTSETLPNGSSLNYSYDSNGNRLSLTSSGTTGLPYASQAYTYTGNQLSSWSINGVTQALTVLATGEIATTHVGGAQYDHKDRRRSEWPTTNGTSPADYQWFDYNHLNERTLRLGPDSRQYVYDESSHLIGEYDGNGHVIVEYIWLGDRPVAAIYAGNRIIYLVTDYQGKPRQGLDASTGAQVWAWNPDAFGALQPATGISGGVTMNLRFPGQYYDSQNGLYYNHNRYYNPELGHYMEPDPIGMEGGLNPYAYTENDPVNNVDPSGLLGYDNLAGGIIGLLSGGLSSAAGQYAFNSDHHINLYDVVVAASVGAGAGAVSPWTAATTGGAVMTGMVAGEYQYIATQLVDKQPITLTGLGVNMLAGAAAGGAGGAVGAAAGKTQVGPSTFIPSSLSGSINAANVGNNIVSTGGRNLGAAFVGAGLSSDPIVTGASQATAQLSQSLYGPYQQGNGAGWGTPTFQLPTIYVNPGLNQDQIDSQMQSQITQDGY